MTVKEKVDDNMVYAKVAELVDAHGSGPCELTLMGVRLSSLVPTTFVKMLSLASAL